MSTDQLVTRLLDLWAHPIDDPDKALAEFAAVYTDPVTINGAAMPLTGLVDRATALHRALERTGVEILDVVTQGDQVVVAFTMIARHIGPWPSPLGEVAATGRTVTVRTIDILTLTDGLISAICVVNDEAGMLAQMGVSLPATR
jgi:predicted ester cyclase